jgi:lambda family phage portal protein
MSFADKFDGIISNVAPIWAAKRKAARHAMQLQASYYRGGNTNRLSKNWSVSVESADTALDQDLQSLRDASRDLNRNDPVASSVTDTFCVNTIHTGMVPQSRIDYETIGISEAQAEIFQKSSERLYRQWAPWASANGKMHFNWIQYLAARQIAECGEFLAVRRAIDTTYRPFLLALDVVEPDRLETPGKIESDKDVKYGIRQNTRGEHIRYYIRKTHPGDQWVTNDQSEYVTVNGRDRRGALQVYHLYPILRPGQTRGIPFFAPVIEKFRQLADYMEATIVAARVAACFAVFVTSESPYAAASAASDELNANNQRIENLEPGIVQYLSSTGQVYFARPEQPTTTFSEFCERILRLIGASVGLPYELIHKDFSKTNYSSAKAALEQAYRFFKGWQKFIELGLCQPVWESLLWEAWNRNMLVAPGYLSNIWDYNQTEWITAGWQSIEPFKEAKADEIALKNHFTTLAHVTAKTGKDWEQIIAQRGREIAKLQENGLDLADESEEETEIEETGNA